MPIHASARATDCQNCAIREVCTVGRLGSEGRSQLVPQVRERVFRRDEVLLEEGLPAQFVRIVKTGTVFAYRRGLDGRSRPIGVANRGYALGLFGVFDMPSQATCVAVTAARVCELPVPGLRSLLACGPGMIELVGRSVAESFAAATAWSEAMRLPGTARQLAYVLVLLADAQRATTIELPSQSALAQLLGARRETVARALAALERAGSIRRVEHRRFEVHRSALLEGLPPRGR